MSIFSPFRQANTGDVNVSGTPVDVTYKAILSANMFEAVKGMLGLLYSHPTKSEDENWGTWARHIIAMKRVNTKSKRSLIGTFVIGLDAQS
jgi:hypothetical protein